MLIRQKEAEIMKQICSPSTVTTSGYGGALLGTNDQTIVSIRIDLVNESVNVLIVSDIVQDIPVVIGPTFLNKSVVLLIVSRVKV